MKLIHSIYLLPLALLTACHSEQPLTPTRTCGPIDLQAGIVEGGAAVTKAGAEDHHAKHLNLTSGTKLTLQVSGTWTGHSPSAVELPTTATVGAATGADNKHNALTCSPVRYWDDFGTADPDNAATGRTEGLTIYGVAINGKTTAPSVSSWTALEWSLVANQNTSGGTPADKDLLISNNVQAGTGDGTYLFTARASGKLLEFTHALSKITVNLHAGDGFGGAFASNPIVLLINNWAYTTGTVNVTTGAWSSQDGATVFTMCPAASVTENYHVTKEALVIPGSAFASDDTDIIRINADGNVYYVTAEKIRTAINSSTHGTDGAYTTEAGKNYIINVIVNKTRIDVTATVTDWTDVTAAEVQPVINVAANWGDASGTAMTKDEFSLYLRTADTEYGTEVGDYYREERRVKYESSTWVMKTMPSSEWETTPLYWPNHNTHYQFRGIWPCTGTGTGTVTYPRIEKVGDNQVIKVENVAYTADSFPSDLQIARPNVATDATCTNSESGHTTTNLYSGGICATEGSINLEFSYMMSQVQVNLSTTDGDDQVRLTGAVVEIINGYTAGNVDVDSRTVETTGSTGSYTLHTLSGVGNEDKRLDAIVPQSLEGVRFKITITNADSTTDVYYADVAPIKKTGSSDPVAPNGAWESGYHYIYNLKLSKTQVNVSATLANWTTVNADENVWF